MTAAAARLAGCFRAAGRHWWAQRKLLFGAGGAVNWQDSSASDETRAQKEKQQLTADA